MRVLAKILVAVAACGIVSVPGAEAHRYHHHSSVLASWYGGGEKLAAHTANGERFRPGGLTAAHRSLPMGTRIQVTNVTTGRAVVVRINDRGPAAWTGRSLDLSRGAAQAIGMHGVAHVAMTVL